MSRMIKCENGHHYDAEKFRKCPFCRQGVGRNKNVLIEGGVSADMDDAVTMSGPGVFGGIGGRRRITMPKVTGRTVRPPAGLLDQESAPDERQGLAKKIADYADTVDVDPEKTVSLNQLSTGVDPVIGWLVCVSGEDKGKDYRLIAGRNRIGRSAKMDVTILTDKKVTREEHCSVVYDDKSNSSFLLPGSGTLTYHKGEMLCGPKELASGDELEIGETRFVFIKFCEGERAWKNYE